MGYRKFKFSSYVIAGQGIGLRVILPFAAFMGILCGFGLYIATMMAYGDIIDGLKQLPHFKISHGKIVEPIEKEKLIKLTDQYNLILDTEKFDIKESDVPQNAFMYITASKVYLQVGVFLKDCPLISEKARERFQNAFVPINLSDVKYGTYSVEKELIRVISMYKLFCVFIAAQMVLTILVTFLIIWVFVWFLELFLKHGLTSGQLARLLTMPYCTLVGGVIILGLSLGSWFIPWFLFMPYVTMNINLIAAIMPFGELISSAYRGYSFPFLMQLGWMAGLPLLLIWYFIWVGSIRISRERQKEFMEQMKPKAEPKEENEEDTE